MTGVRMVLGGDRPQTPQEKVLAMAAFARAIADEPAEAVMLLLTAAVRISRACSPKDRDEQDKGISETLPWAINACDGFWPPDEERPAGETLQ